MVTSVGVYQLSSAHTRRVVAAGLVTVLKDLVQHNRHVVHHSVVHGRGYHLLAAAQAVVADNLAAALQQDAQAIVVVAIPWVVAVVLQMVGTPVGVGVVVHQNVVGVVAAPVPAAAHHVVAHRHAVHPRPGALPHVSVNSALPHAVVNSAHLNVVR
ncbi:unnamed protein product [Allacma fusca]|uniref:Uncharacterized protein n=1 Tax=Allacma fusca TaxID=39272 RepID=A0A8J2PQD9_9HEXA|nr:unnamed protein product [Allacma fusca]